MSDPTARVLQLLSLLQTHRFWSGAELASRLEVSDRTLRRDVDRLRQLGYPVDAITGSTGGYRLGSGAHMPPLLLDDDEAVAIAVGLLTAAGAAITGIEDTSVRAFAKLDQILPDRLRRRVDALHANVVPLRWGSDVGPRVDPETLSLLSMACRDQEQVRFEYQRRDGEESRRLVEPHQLVSSARRWYLVAWDLRREDWRSFRLDRMVDARLAGVRNQPRDLPAEDAAAFVVAGIKAMSTNHVAEVIIDGEREAVEGATRYLSGQISDAGDGRHRVRLEAEQINWLAMGVAGLAMDFGVTLVEPCPPELRRRLEAITTRLKT